jgi:hypothetical protein
MKKNSQTAGTAVANGAVEDAPSAKRNGAAKRNGHSNGTESSGDLSLILAGLQTMRNGDFSVRLPGSWTGLPTPSTPS